MGFEHGVHAGTPVSAEDARHVARVMSALATTSRVRILGRLREQPCTVGELALAVEMEQPAVSHQLRILRDLGLVLGSRNGRHVTYGLYDSHVATLLDEALRHIEHLRAGPAGTTPDHEGDSMTEHSHDAPHAHEHEHDGETHVHAHTGHDHEHVEHEHDHEHDGEKHAHPHVHEAGVEDVHEHEHA